MSPAFTFFIGLLLLILFGWYFATDYGLRKRLLATLLAAMLVAFSIATIWPPEKKIALGLDIKGGTSFLIKLQQVDKDKPITPGLLDQAVEVIRKRVDYFGGGEPIISPVGQDRILVQIPGLDTAKIQEARDQLSRVAKLEFRLVYPDNGGRLKAIDAGKEVIPPEYRIEVYKPPTEGNEKPREERLLVKKKADLGGNRVSESHAHARDGFDSGEHSRRLDGPGDHARVRVDLLQTGRSRRLPRATRKYSTAGRRVSIDSWRRHSDSTRHRRYHPDDRPRRGRERTDLRTAARGNGARKIAQDRGANRLPKSVQLHLRR